MLDTKVELHSENNNKNKCIKITIYDNKKYILNDNKNNKKYIK